MIIKFRTGGFSRSPIEKIKVERETEVSVWINGSRSAKDSSWHKYWDTWEQAHTYLLEKSERSLEAARKALEGAQGQYGNIKGMKAPPEPN
jgi:poly(3-hydroxyalkanoate) synthetase